MMSSTNKDANDDFIDVVADVDMTGTSVNLIDADVDPITESNCSGRSILLVEEDGDDDPETETNCSGRSILRIDEDVDPETETNCSGRSILLVEEDGDDDPETETNCSGRSILLVEEDDSLDNVALQYAVNSSTEAKTPVDPLSDFEESAIDMTGVCVNNADTMMADHDPETETNCSGRSILLVEEGGDDDPETETNCSGRSILLVEEGGDDDPETETNCSGRSILFIDDEDEPETDYDATGCGISGMVKD